MQVLSWATAAADCCVDGSGAERPAGLQPHLLLLRGIARRLQLLRHLLIHLVQLAFSFCRRENFWVQILISARTGRFPRSTWATLENFKLIQVRLQPVRPSVCDSCNRTSAASFCRFAREKG